jgi:hypothetical protein
MGRGGVDLFRRHGINSQALGLPRHDEIRRVWAAFPYKDSSAAAARNAFEAVVAIVREAAQPEKHCATCRCPTAHARSVDWDMVARLLEIDPAEIVRAEGGW